MTIIARPYATAAFEYALEKQEIPAWQTFLETASQITNDKRVKRLLTDPAISKKQLAELYIGILQSDLNPERQNFIDLLAENNRLDILPEIVTLFRSYRTQHEKAIDVRVLSAVPLDDNYKQRLDTALSKRLQRKVTMEYAVDANLLGGILVRAGDMVIDGSIRGKLNRLLDFSLR